MRHPPTAWADPSYEHESLRRLISEYLTYLRGRTRPASEATVRAYRQALDSLTSSIEQAGETAELGQLTPYTVSRWIAERRKRGCAEEGLASWLAAVKAFARSYVQRHLELTTVDLLTKVPRIDTKEAKPKQMLSEAERNAIFDSFGQTYEGTRDRAMVATFLATGLRFRAITTMDDASLDRISGEIRVVDKGAKNRVVRLSPTALKMVKSYLRIRPTSESGKLWLTAEGGALTYWGGQTVFRRLKRVSGVTRVHAHLLRHTFAQGALLKGAERAAVQDMLGHSTDVMTRRYCGTIRQETAARMMPQYSLV